MTIASDREIFRIRDEISAYEKDPGATFYDILEIKPSASLDDINKAYRAKTRSLHPDKVKQQLRAARAKEAAASGKKEAKPLTSSEVKAAVKAADEAYARLTLIAGILRGPSRDRYNHFVTNGFPLWKGTDYYYNRYRPGLGTVMVGLFIVVGGGVHYIILYMGWKRQKEFIGRYVKFARDTAWGPGMSIPGVDEAEETGDAEEDPSMQALNRKQRRQMEKEKKSGSTAKKARRLPATKTTAPDGTEVTKKRVVAENGKILVVDADGNVFLEEQDEEGNVNEYLLDVSCTADVDWTTNANENLCSPNSFLCLASRTLLCSAPLRCSSRLLSADSCLAVAARQLPMRARTARTRQAPTLLAATLSFWTRAPTRSRVRRRLVLSRAVSLRRERAARNKQQITKREESKYDTEKTWLEVNGAYGIFSPPS